MSLPPSSWRATAAAALLLSSIACRAEVLLRDDFDQASLDNSVWSVAGWSLGRTQFGTTPQLVDGVARLTLQTYNPSAPGAVLLGTEIYTKQSFALGAGIEISARIRLQGVDDGAVASVFTYNTTPSGATNEIDIELLTKQTNQQPDAPTVSLTNWNEWQESDGFDNGPAHWSTSPAVAGLDLSAFNTFTIRWLPGETQWLMNGQLTATSTEAVPSQATPLHLNFWAPASTWTDAFSASLQPTQFVALNHTYVYEVDSIVVSSIPEPATIALWALGLAGLVVRMRRLPQSGADLAPVGRSA